ncbi:formate/nitrite transporter family protein [Herbaspirillum sp. HC18]|nr:formate/nitrite transporter family protein [Herbaspirillum sp. HC18]
MARPLTSLWWSGLAAGLSISFSLLTQGILAMYLPDAAWRQLVIALGYPVGFLIVVLSRQQLFTETTITVVLPVMADPTFANLARAVRMWGIVLAANLFGTFIAAIFITFSPAVSPELRQHMLEISRHAVEHGWVETAFLGITSGYLMAATVWLIPGAGTAQFHIIYLMTYLIGAGGFTHIVAGGVEAFLLVCDGGIGLGEILVHFMAPALIGNIVGGTVLFALISYAQVMKEM